MPTNKEPTHGGKRPGSGQKLKYKEPTTTVAFRCPVSKVEELKQIVKETLLAWQKDSTVAFVPKKEFPPKVITDPNCDHIYDKYRAGCLKCVHCGKVIAI